MDHSDSASLFHGDFNSDVRRMFEACSSYMFVQVAGHVHKCSAIYRFEVSAYFRAYEWPIQRFIV